MFNKIIASCSLSLKRTFLCSFSISQSKFFTPAKHSQRARRRVAKNDEKTLGKTRRIWRKLNELSFRAHEWKIVEKMEIFWNKRVINHKIISEDDNPEEGYFFLVAVELNNISISRFFIADERLTLCCEE